MFILQHIENKFMKQCIALILIALAVISCRTEQEIFEDSITLEVQNKKPKYSSDDTIMLNLNYEGAPEVDSIVWRQNYRKLQSGKEMSLSRKLKNAPLGKLTFTAEVFAEGRMASKSTQITRYASKKPKVYRYNIVNKFPHKKDAFTQGLEFHNGKLYESTGQYGQSSVRIVEVETGNVIEKSQLQDGLFGEGLTVWEDRVIQLTWRAGYGLVYDLQLEQEDTFKYGQSDKGWGLCHDDKYIYKSDGTDKIWLLDPDTYEELEYIQATSNDRTFSNLNELEYVDGKIYANVWQQGYIIIINPANGQVEAVLNTKDLINKLENKKGIDVLNGIAYQKETGHLFLTGKRWDTLFEVKVIK